MFAVLPANWPFVLDAGAVLVSLPSLICAGFVYFHCTGRWMVLNNKHGKGLWRSHYHGSYSYWTDVLQLNFFAFDLWHLFGRKDSSLPHLFYRGINRLCSMNEGFSYNFKRILVSVWLHRKSCTSHNLLSRIYITILTNSTSTISRGGKVNISPRILWSEGAWHDA